MKNDQELGNTSNHESVTPKTGLPDRLLKARDSLGKTQRQMSELLGIGKNTWQNYESSGQVPGSQIIERLVRLGFNANWILTGVGNMLLDQPVDDLPTKSAIDAAEQFLNQLSDETTFDYVVGGEGDYEVNFPMDAGASLAKLITSFSDSDSTVDKSEYAFIPLYDVEACAGHGSYVEQESVAAHLAFRRDWLHQELRATPSNLHLIYVRGDSMAPDLKDGEVIMVDTTTRGTLVRDDIYVVRIDDTVAVKMLARLPGGRVKVMSKNQDYGSFETDLENIHIIGQVIWHAGRI